MNKQLIYGVDIAVICFSLACLIFLVGYTQPLVISPLDGYETTGTEVLFEIEKADAILIDDTKDFTSPDRYFVEDGMHIKLEPGVYYWKAEGVTESSVRTLTIQTLAELQIRRLSEDSYGVANGGNIAMNVDVYEKGSLVETVSLKPTNEAVTSGDRFEGGMK